MYCGEKKCSRDVKMFILSGRHFYIKKTVLNHKLRGDITQFSMIFDTPFPKVRFVTLVSSTKSNVKSQNP